jgi:hypothetical protein
MTHPTSTPMTHRFSRTPRRRLALGACLLVVAACERGSAADTVARTPADSAWHRAAAGAAIDQGRDSRRALSRPAAAALDSGNVHYRAGRLDAALVAYRTAAQHAPDHAAPWYGVFMVAQQQKNATLADSAMAAIRARTSSAATLTDSTMSQVHAGGAIGTTTKRPLPSGHPPVVPR